MTEIGSLIVDIALACVMVWIAYQYYSTFFKSKKNTLLTYGLWGIYFLFQLWTEMPNQVPFIWILIGNIALQIILMAFQYYGPLLKKTLFIILLYGIIAMIEMAVYVVLVRLPVTEQQFGMLGSILSKLAAILFVHVLNLVYRKKKAGTRIDNPYFMILFSIPLFSMFIAYNLFYMDGRNSFSFISIGILLLINLLIFELYYELSNQFDLEKENLLFENQIQLLTKYTEEQEKMRNEICETRHNLKNRMIVLKRMLEDDDKEAALELVDGLMNQSKDTSLIHTGNKMIDAILNSKCTLAQTKGISLDTKIYIPTQIPIEQSDLGVLLGNALDNAIEACEGSKEDKTIHIIISVKRNTFLIRIVNPFCGEIQRDQTGQIISSKKEKQNHGFGIRSMVRIAEKYDGKVTIDVEADHFCFYVSIPLD